MSYRLYSIVVLLLLGRLILAQDLTYKIISIDDGLSNRIIHDMTSDDQGYAWLCTQSNVNYYDGFEIEPLNKTFGNDDIRQDCQRILHRSNSLLIQSFEKEDNFLYVDLKNKKHQRYNINSLYGTSKKYFYKTNAEFYFCQLEDDGASLYKFNFIDAQFDKLFKLSSKELDLPFVFSALRDGQYLFIMDNYRCIVTEKNGDIVKNVTLDIPFDRSLTPNYLYSDRVERNWLSVENQQEIFHIDLDNNIVTAVPDIVLNTEFVKINEDAKKNISLLTGDNLNTRAAYAIDSLGIVTDRSDLIDINNHILGFCSSDYNTDYCLYSYDGLYHFYNRNDFVHSIFKRKRLKSSLGGHIVRNLSKGADNKLFFSKESISNPMFFDLDDDAYQISELKNKLTPGFVCNYDFFVDDRNILWRLGCNEKIQGRIESYNLENKNYQIDKSGFTFTSFCNAGDLIYITSSTEGVQNKVLVFNKTTRKITSLPIQGDSPFTSKEIFVNYLKKQEDILWVCTNQGLLKYDINQQSFDELKDHTAIKDINILHLTIHGDELVIGTRNNGLIIYNLQTKTTEKFDASNGLSDQTIASSHIDYRGNIWVATFNGLNIIHRKSGFIGRFQEEDGLSNNEFNRYAMEVIDSHRLFLGTLNGITEINIDNYYRESRNPLQIQEFIVRNNNGLEIKKEDLRWNKSKELIVNKPGQNIAFKFRSIDYINGQQYQARLIGLNESWTNLGANNTYAIGALQKGEYTLEVRSANNYGQSTGDILRQKIIVKSPLYKNIWFIFSIALLFLSSIGLLIYRIRIKQVHANAARRSKLRTKFAELELESLRSQMNPHFIFNTLGSIQYFIQKADVQSADEYLSKFALLIRKYLEASKNKYITIAEEFKLLRLYIELEQLRSDHGFDMEIKIDNAINLNNVKIPSMLMQPYVENAILHGLLPLKGRHGKLTITADYNHEGYLKLKIEDNGVGREQAQINKLASNVQYKSRGTNLVRDRINTLNKVTHSFISLETIDKKNEQLEAMGTTVEITIKNRL